MNARRVAIKLVAQNAVIQAQQHLVVGLKPKIRRYIMWTKPAVTEMRFGFEVTMYVCNR